jgi:hypothetical protein
LMNARRLMGSLSLRTHPITSLSTPMLPEL